MQSAPAKARIEIRFPFPVEDLPLVWRWMQESEYSLLTDQGPQTAEQFVDSWLHRPAMTWGVYRDGDLGGWVAYEPESETTGNAHCVFRRSFCGKGITDAAINRMAAQLFGEGVERVGMIAREGNIFVQRLIERLGAEKEALWYKVRERDGTTVTKDGVPVRMVQYGLYREAWYDAHQNTQPNAFAVDIRCAVDGLDSRLDESAA